VTPPNPLLLSVYKKIFAIHFLLFSPSIKQTPLHSTVSLFPRLLLLLLLLLRFVVVKLFRPEVSSNPSLNRTFFFSRSSFRQQHRRCFFSLLLSLPLSLSSLLFSINKKAKSLPELLQSFLSFLSFFSSSFFFRSFALMLR